MTVDKNSMVLDHIVLSVLSTELARGRLNALGFQVANDAQHPFGTQNACVFFADDTYLEPLAIGDAALYEQALAGGNTFVKLFQQFRIRAEKEGLAGIALKSLNAAGDHLRFTEFGISGGDMLRFSRPITSDNMPERLASFELAFSQVASLPDFYVFTCQRINAGALSTDVLRAHENGVTGLAGVILCADQNTHGYFDKVFGARGEDYAMGKAFLRITDRQTFEREFASKQVRNGVFCGKAVAFTVADLTRTARFFDTAGVDYSMVGRRIVVSPEPGQGAIFVFEDESA